MKTFLAVGDILINPSLLAHAVVEHAEEGPRLRLTFASGAAGRSEVRLAGEEAAAVLRWLRLNATFLDRAAVLGQPGSSAKRNPLHGTRRAEEVHNLDLCVAEGPAR